MRPGSTAIIVRAAQADLSVWKTVRCENESCRHIVFRYARESVISGALIIEVKCRCKTMNKVRIVPQGRSTVN
jgi:phage FluMu protein Com